MISQRYLVVILTTITICYAHEHVYCGRSLARVLAAVCYKQYPDKKSDGTMYNEILSPYYKDQDGLYGWVWPPHQARALSLPSRDKRLIVNECCDKPCTISELLSYCDS